MTNKELKLLFEILLNPNSNLLDYSDNELKNIGLTDEEIKFRGKIPVFNTNTQKYCILALLNHFNDLDNRINILENRVKALEIK